VNWLKFAPLFLAFLIVGGISTQQEVFANSPTLFVKTSTVVADADQDVRLDFYLKDTFDLYGIQIDMATSLNQGALPLEPKNKTTPFILEDASLFKNDLTLLNKYDASSEVSSLLTTRQLSESTGYQVNKVKLVASIQLKAMMNITSVPEIIKIGDDLLSMQLGITSITIKLSTSTGQKITYNQGQADVTKPTINLSKIEETIALNSSFEITSVYAAFDNQTLLEDLSIQTSSFHRTDLEGEYIITIHVKDEFHNFSISLFKLIVGNPYNNIEVTYANR
jgi:hypothetical protein